MHAKKSTILQHLLELKSKYYESINSDSLNQNHTIKKYYGIVSYLLRLQKCNHHSLIPDHANFNNVSIFYFYANTPRFSVLSVVLLLFSAKGKKCGFLVGRDHRDSQPLPRPNKSLKGLMEPVSPPSSQVVPSLLCFYFFSFPFF